MVIIDCPSVVKDRKMFSARGAGILGFSIFGSKKIYALNDDMRLDMEGLEAFFDQNKNRKILLFGFTFMVWQYFYKELARLKAEGKTFDLSQAVLIHGGGWKKLAGEAVSPEAFRKALKDVCGIESVHDYYGIPSRDFPQIRIINRAIRTELEKYAELKPYILLLRYERDKDINDVLSSLCDVRVIWGGDSTIMELRKSPLPPRATEVTFADRYSLAVIDSGEYIRRIKADSKAASRTASDFYNDTYLFDQNACTSPRVVAWAGCAREEATLIDETAVISDTALIGEGCIIQAHAVVSSEAVIKENCMFMLQTIVGHHAVVESHCVASPKATVGGYSHVGAGAFLGLGSSMMQGVDIGSGAIVGMGSMVFKNVEDGATVIGNPARVTKGNSEHKVFNK